MSVGAGRLKGRKLAVPAGTRPSSGRLREALFSIWGERIEDADVLDLFAGSGSVGIEAWSRGARAVTLVESGRRALADLRHNVQDLSAAGGAARVVPLPVERALARLAAEGRRFDLVFADPPYERQLGAPFFQLARRVAMPTTSLALEHRRSAAPDADPPGWRRISVRPYGGSALSLFEPSADG